MRRAIIQKEARGFSVWSASPFTGSKIDCLAFASTARSARAIARKYEAKEGDAP